MVTSVSHPEVFGLTESSLVLCFDVEDNKGPVDAPARVHLNGQLHGESAGFAGTRLLRIEGLEPDSEYEIDIVADGGGRAAPDAYFQRRVRTMAAPAAEQTACFATLNDLHFGEPRFGGRPTPDGDTGPEAPGYPGVLETEGQVPYWQVMNGDAVADINAADVDCTIIKGDIADMGRPEQFAIARQTFDRFEQPHHVLLGNHDYYAWRDGNEVDGYDLLGQPETPRHFELGGFRIIFLDTVIPGKHHGRLNADRLSWLSQALEQARDLKQPTLIFMHHQPVPAGHEHKLTNRIGIPPADSHALFGLLGQHPQLKGVLIGHTHRNRVRRYSESGDTPYVEVHCVKDYPGGFGHYRLFADGSFRQEARRTSSQRALSHSRRCRDFFRGSYKDFSLGKLSDRSFCVT